MINLILCYNYMFILVFTPTGKHFAILLSLCSCDLVNVILLNRPIPRFML